MRQEDVSLDARRIIPKKVASSQDSSLTQMSENHEAYYAMLDDCLRG